MTTPRPWYAVRAGNAHDQGLIVSEKTGATVAVTYQGKSDAEFIARACNVHATLVAACKRALIEYRAATGRELDDDAVTNELVAAIREAEA